MRPPTTAHDQADRVSAATPAAAPARLAPEVEAPTIELPPPPHDERAVAPPGTAAIEAGGQQSPEEPPDRPSRLPSPIVRHVVGHAVGQPADAPSPTEPASGRQQRSIAGPRVAPAPATAPPAGTPEEVHVHIGRIEVTAVREPPAERRPRRAGKPPMTLDEYLAKRSDG